MAGWAFAQVIHQAFSPAQFREQFTLFDFSGFVTGSPVHGFHEFWGEQNRMALFCRMSWLKTYARVVQPAGDGKDIPVIIIGYIRRDQ